MSFPALAEGVASEIGLSEGLFVPQENEAEPYILSEATERREETAKHFRMSDGSYIVAQYNTRVHYLDENGNVTKNTVSSNYRSIATSYNYNDDGMLGEVEISSSRRKSYIYSDEGVLTSTSMSTATPVTEAFTYNDEGYIASHDINGTVYSYSYDANGNITEIKKNGVVQQSYVYDELNQLLRENNLDTGKTIVYDYDGSGNILSKTEYAYTLSENIGVATDTVNYTYDDIWKDKLTSYDGQSITYDSIGNPTNYMGATMTWFARQMMTYETDDLDISYKYDTNGLRTEKTVNDVTHSYYYVDGLLRTEQIGDTYVLNYRYDDNGTLLSVSSYNISTEAVNILYAQTNTRGDVIALYDGNGATRVIYTYDSWGKLISATDASGNALGENTVGVLNSVRYRGYVYDSETGLYYLQSRYYDPEVGRFLNADAVDFIGYSGEVLSYNIFAYCENNAIMYADRLGMLGLGAIATAIGLTAADLVVAALLIMVIADLATGGRVILGFSEALGLLVDSFINTISSSLSSSNTATKTKTLSDTKAKLPKGKPYQLAYVNDKNELIKLYPKYSLQEILVMLGFTNATDSIDQIYEYDNGKSSELQRKVQPLGKGKNYWGVYTKNQSDAKALATVLGVTDPPEVHGTGMYGHYNSRNKADEKAHFHIWFGAKLSY